MLEKILTMLPKSEIKQNQWYIGRGRNTNIALSHDDLFLTLCYKVNRWVVKGEGHFDDKFGCFQPFVLFNDLGLLRNEEQSILQKNKWYYGDGEHSSIAYWNGQDFLTIIPEIGKNWTFARLEKEPYFIPYSVISEGEMIEPFGKIAWDAHYGKKLKI